MSLNAPLGLPAGQQPQARSLSSKNPFRNRGAVSPATNAVSSGNPQSPSIATTTPALNQGYFAPTNGSPASPFTPATTAGGLNPSPINTFQQQPDTNLGLPLAPVSPISPLLTATSPALGAVQQPQQQRQQPTQQQSIFGPSLTSAPPQPLPSPRPMSTNPFLSDSESVAFSAFIEQQKQLQQLQQQQQQQQQQQLLTPFQQYQQMQHIQQQLQQPQAQQQPIASRNPSVSPVMQPPQQATPLRQPRMADLDGFQSLTLNDNTQPPHASQYSQQQQPPNTNRLLHQRTVGDLKQKPSSTDPSSEREGLLIDIFADPEPVSAGPTTRANNRQPPFAPTFGGGAPRPRRNSDTSIMERERAPQKFERLNVEDERRKRAVDRERRYREMSHRGSDKEHSHQYRERKDSRDHEHGRSERHRRHEGERSRRDKGDEKDGRRRGKSTKPNRKLDVIDKLDLTGIYGPGQFHHDGPFDACNPHRNRKGIRAAPMQAFAEDSPSMVPTGGGPRAFDHNLYLGKGEDPYNDFSRTAIKQAVHVNNSQPKPDVATYDPKGKIEPVHGEETMGLGTSTFLDGAPASRAAIQENQRGRSVDETYLGPPGEGGGLQRKKSLAQRMKLGSHTHARDRTLTDRPLRVTSPDRMDDGPGRRKGSLPNGARVAGAGGSNGHGSGSPSYHPHHATSTSYDSYDRSSFDRDGKTPNARSKTIDPTYANDGDEVDDFGRPILGRRGSDGWTAGHGNRHGSGSGSGSGSGGGLLGRMKSLRKRER